MFRGNAGVHIDEDGLFLIQVFYSLFLFRFGISDYQEVSTMAGTLAQTRLQLQNAESSVLFMQQEHANTLQGLYTEINKLQKKCGGRWYWLCY